jgi:putative transposase
MVTEAGGWAWSSDRATAGMQEAPGWLDVAAALSLFDRTLATARTASRRFMAEGIHQPAPWKGLRGQISAFRQRIARLVQGTPLTNVPALQPPFTRLSPDEILQHVAATYRLPVAAILARSHRDANQTAVYVLRRAANEPLQTVARRFRISPSRISNIQKAIQRAPRSLQQTQLFATCHVKTPILSMRLKLGFPYKLRDADHDAADGSVAGFVLKS